MSQLSTGSYIHTYIIGSGVGARVLDNCQKCPSSGEGFEGVDVGRHNPPWSHSGGDLEIISCHGDHQEASGGTVSYKVHLKVGASFGVRQGMGLPKIVQHIATLAAILLASLQRNVHSDMKPRDKGTLY